MTPELAAGLLGGIVESAGIGVAVLDEEGRYVYANQRLAAINGVPVEAHVGRTLREVIPHIADVVEPLHADVVRSGQPRLNVQVRGSTLGAPDRIWQAAYLPTVFDGAPAVGVVITDVTERERAAAELAELSARRREAVLRSLEREERERGQMADVLQDDVLQHLLFARQELDAQGDGGGRALASLNEAVGLLRAVVSTLHPVTLAHTGLEPALVNLATEVRARRGLAVDVDVAPGPTGPHDGLVYSLAREVLDDLAENGAGTASVRVSAGAGAVVLQIEGHGSDRGLAVVRERVEAIGGGVAVVPGHPGRWTAVELRLPDAAL